MIYQSNNYFINKIEMTIFKLNRIFCFVFVLLFVMHSFNMYSKIKHLFNINRVFK